MVMLLVDGSLVVVERVCEALGCLLFSETECVGLEEWLIVRGSSSSCITVQRSRVAMVVKSETRIRKLRCYFISVVCDRNKGG